MFAALKNYPAVEREMHYVAGERKNRHEENINTVRTKFADTKREIIREKMEEKAQFVLKNKRKESNILLGIRQKLIKK
jgi:hypothetical protein